MNEFSAVSVEELNQVEGGLAFLVVAGLIAVSGATCAAGAWTIGKLMAKYGY
jgi:lactobin A/cerein 7B family class IIb bacteriocin